MAILLTSTARNQSRLRTACQHSQNARMAALTGTQAATGCEPVRSNPETEKRTNGLPSIRHVQSTATSLVVLAAGRFVLAKGIDVPQQSQYTTPPVVRRAHREGGVRVRSWPGLLPGPPGPEVRLFVAAWAAAANATGYA